MLFGGTEIEAQLCWKENVRSKLSAELIDVLGLTIPLYLSHFTYL